LQVDVLETGKGPVVRLRGEAGAEESSALQASLLRLVARRPACVTIDLSELVFISSLAIGVLVTYRRGSVRAGTRVCLAAEFHPAVREALDRVALMSLFEVDDAAEACAGPGPVAQATRTPLPNVNEGQHTDGVS
jgi:anti-anti-sigma factor